jgi:hypothetical protein
MSLFNCDEAMLLKIFDAFLSEIASIIVIIDTTNVSEPLTTFDMSYYKSSAGEIFKKWLLVVVWQQKRKFIANTDHLMTLFI